MAASHILRLAKLKGGGRLLAAARHNRRTIQSELGADSNIDVTRSKLNYSLAGAGTPEAINADAKALMQAAGIDKTRKDCVQAVEVIYSLPASHNVNLQAYFEDCLKWTRLQFRGHVLSFDVHLDESAPHAHALILPLVDGRIVGSDMVGYKSRLRLLQTGFYEAVGIKYGLQRPSAKLSGQTKSDTARAVLNRLKSDPVMKSLLWPLIRDLISNDPAAFAHVLGIVIAKAKARVQKSAVAIMTSKGKGSNPIGFHVR
jgi:hypothetical protein